MSGGGGGARWEARFLESRSRILGHPVAPAAGAPTTGNSSSSNVLQAFIEGTYLFIIKVQGGYEAVKMLDIKAASGEESCRSPVKPMHSRVYAAGNRSQELYLVDFSPKNPAKAPAHSEGLQVLRGQLAFNFILD
ncbi:hypothetical protein KSP40_PGU020014 [Platanthera guangdongensis]|uniref:Uncharacterized protein n=1 Tax=Platanthera guangdongensis TaxID=2320717 RepID=A0ABR2MGL7_9ASPA